LSEKEEEPAVKHRASGKALPADKQMLRCFKDRLKCAKCSNILGYHLPVAAAEKVIQENTNTITASMLNIFD